MTVLFLLSFSAFANPSLWASSRSSANDQAPTPRAAVPRVINTNDLDGPVNPFINVNIAYTQEPAPMGVADYGIGPSGPYSYSTNSSLGSVDIVSLSAQNSTGYPWMSMQLNVNLQFIDGGSQFVYWIQDVADVDTTTNTIYFLDNVWNSSAPKAVMSDTGVVGNGQVAQAGSGSTTSYFYYDEAGASLPGNGVDLTYPATVDFRVNSSVDASKQPVVTFEYNDGYGWQEYDSVAFIAVHSLTAMDGFVVDGFAYNPVNFYDSELILGGPGGGSSTSDVQSDLRLQLEFWNGHNYQLVTNAYNFGSDTAEGITNALSQWFYYPVNGGVIAEIKSGPGTLGKLWDQTGVGVVDMKTPVPSGTLDVRNSSNFAGTPGVYPFENGEVTVTLEPGSYQLQVYSGNTFITSGEYTLAAGQRLQLTGPLGVVPFTLSYSIIGGGVGYSAPTLTYKYNGIVQTASLGATPTVYDMDSGSTWSVALQLLGSSSTERWQTDQATNGTAVPGQSASITYYHQYAETVSFSVTGGGSGYSAPSLSGSQFGADVSLQVGTSPVTYWLDDGTAYSATDPLPGSSAGERWSSTGIPGSVTVSGSIVLSYDHQFYLAVTGGSGASQWYASGTQAALSQPVVFGRAGGTGQRVVSYSVDGGAEVPVTTIPGNFTVSLTMDASHTVSFASVTQFQVTLQTVALQELESITPPTISGDSYWYDSGSAVSVTLFGVWDRSAGEGQRLVSYSIDGGAQVPVSSNGSVAVMTLSAISSSQVIAVRSTAQFFLNTGLGSLVSVSPTPVTGDTGWYDNQTSVVATYNYTWSASAGQTRLDAVSYSIDGGQASPLSRKGSGTFAVSLTMGAPHQIQIQPVTQYRFVISGGFDVTLSSQSPTGDGFYDANSSTTVSSSYIGGTVPDKERQALSGYTLDSKTTSVPTNDSGTFTAPLIVFDTYHALAFDSVEQYFVSFAFTDSSASTQVVPTSLAVDQNGGGAQDVPGFEAWIDNGTTFTVASVIWEGVDVKPLNAAPYQATAPENITVKSRIYSASMRVTDLFGLSVQGAQVSARLANGTTAIRTTGSNGVATFGLIPIGTYQATVSNLGTSSSTSADASQNSESTATVALSLAVLGAVLVVAILIIGALVVTLRRRSKSGPSTRP